MVFGADGSATPPGGMSEGLDCPPFLLPHRVLLFDFRSNHRLREGGPGSCPHLTGERGTGTGRPPAAPRGDLAAGCRGSTFRAKPSSPIGHLARCPLETGSLRGQQQQCPRGLGRPSSGRLRTEQACGGCWGHTCFRYGHHPRIPSSGSATALGGLVYPRRCQLSPSSECAHELWGGEVQGPWDTPGTSRRPPSR